MRRAGFRQGMAFSSDAGMRTFAVNLDARIVMAKAPASLKAKLQARGYSLTEVDLAPFILSGGAAYCMTLRLDRASAPQPAILAAE